MTGRESCFERQTWFALGFQFDKVNFSLVSFTNVTNMASKEGDPGDRPSVTVSMIIIIINTITCPFTVVLNVLVIKAVKTTPRLRTNSNILLSCLAVTDVLTGLFTQPFFILWQIFLLLGLSESETLEKCFVLSVIVLQIASYLHLMLVTFERLIAIKFTMKYSNIITDNNIKIAVLVVWIIAFINGVLRGMEMVKVALSLAGLLTLSCILLHCFWLLHHVSRNTSPPREDKKWTIAPRRKGKICQREQSAEDNFVCSWCCRYLPFSTFCLDFYYSYRPWEHNHFSDEQTISVYMWHVKPACQSTDLLLETKGNEKGHFWNKKPGRAFRDTVKEGM